MSNVVGLSSRPPGGGMESRAKEGEVISLRTIVRAVFELERLMAFVYREVP